MAGQLTIDTLKASTGVLATQNGMTGVAKAWIIYNAATNTISSSFNIGSVTVNGTGDFTFNFTTSLPSANYSVVGSIPPNYGLSFAAAIQPFTTSGQSEVAPTTSTFRVWTAQANAVSFNPKYVSIAVFSA